MMTYRYLSILVLAISLISCSSDDDSGAADMQDDPDDPPIADANYFPLVAGNTWTYNNIIEIDGEEPQQSTDVLTLGAETELAGNTYFSFAEEDSQEGFTTGFLTNGALRKENNQLIFTGDVMFGFGDLPTLELPIVEAIVFDTTVQAGAELFSVSESITQTIMDFPVIFDITITTTDAGDFTTFDVGDESFDNVIASSVALNVGISTEVQIFGTTTTIQILQPQDVVISTDYYADGVGLIFSEVNFSYETEDLSQLGFELPIPQMFNSDSSQSIDSFNVELE